MFQFRVLLATVHKPPHPSPQAQTPSPLSPGTNLHATPLAAGTNPPEAPLTTNRKFPPSSPLNGPLSTEEREFPCDPRLYTLTRFLAGNITAHCQL